MTKKDVELIAQALRDSKPEGVKITNGGLNTEGAHDALVAYAQWIDTMRNVTTACALCNPRFDSIRFMTACGYGN